MVIRRGSTGTGADIDMFPLLCAARALISGCCEASRRCRRKHQSGTECARCADTEVHTAHATAMPSHNDSAMDPPYTFAQYRHPVARPRLVFRIALPDYTADHIRRVAGSIADATLTKTAPNKRKTHTHTCRCTHKKLAPSGCGSLPPLASAPQPGLLTHPRQSDPRQSRRPGAS